MNARLSFGEWLEDQLKARRWSQAAFADAVGVSRTTVNSWVNNVQPPRRRAARDIARVLDVDVNEVLVRAGYPPLDPDYRLIETDAAQASNKPEIVDVTDPRVRFFANHVGELSDADWEIIRDLIERLSKN